MPGCRTIPLCACSVPVPCQDRRWQGAGARQVEADRSCGVTWIDRKEHPPPHFSVRPACGPERSRHRTTCPKNRRIRKTRVLVVHRVRAVRPCMPRTRDWSGWCQCLQVPVIECMDSPMPCPDCEMDAPPDTMCKDGTEPVDHWFNLDQHSGWQRSNDRMVPSRIPQGLQKTFRTGRLLPPPHPAHHHPGFGKDPGGSRRPGSSCVFSMCPPLCRRV